MSIGLIILYFCVLQVSGLANDQPNWEPVFYGSSEAKSFTIYSSVAAKTTYPQFQLQFCVGTYALSTDHSRCNKGILLCMETNNRGNIDPNKYNTKEYSKCGDLTASTAILVKTRYWDSGTFFTTDNLAFQINAPTNGYFEPDNQHKTVLAPVEVPVSDGLKSGDEYCVAIELGESPDYSIKNSKGEKLGTFSHRESPSINLAKRHLGGSINFKAFSDSSCKMRVNFKSKQELRCNMERMKWFACIAHPTPYLCQYTLIISGDGFSTKFKSVNFEIEVPDYIQNAMRSTVERSMQDPERGSVLADFGKKGKRRQVNLVQLLEADQKLVIEKNVIKCVEGDYSYFYETGVATFTSGAIELSSYVIFPED